MTNKITKEELDQKEAELKSRIEFEKSVDARQTLQKLEKDLELIRLARIGLAVVND